MDKRTTGGGSVSGHSTSPVPSAAEGLPEWIHKIIARIDARGAHHMSEEERALIWLVDHYYDLPNALAQAQRERDEAEYHYQAEFALGRAVRAQYESRLAAQAPVIDAVARCNFGEALRHYRATLFQVTAPEEDAHG